jgi:glutamate-5-semialdehyde dehydrogenase
MNAVTNSADIAALMDGLGRAAVESTVALAQASSETKNAALRAAAKQIRAQRPAILAANQIDMQQAKERGLSGAMLDRLALDDKRIEAMAKGIEDIVALPDPIGTVIAEWTRPSGTRTR